MRKYSCSGPLVVVDPLGLRPEELEDAQRLRESASIERSSGVFLSSASPVQLTNAVGMHERVPFGVSTMPRAGWSDPTRCSRALRTWPACRPKESSTRPARPAPARVPPNSATAPAIAGRRRNESCFSAVMPVSGWNQCVKCVAPCSSAQSFMRGGHRVCERRIERRAVRDGAPERLVNRLGQPRALRLVCKGKLTVQIGNMPIGLKSRSPFRHRPRSNRTCNIPKYRRAHIQSFPESSRGTK